MDQSNNPAAQAKRERRLAREAAKLAAQQEAEKPKPGGGDPNEDEEPKIKYNNDIPHIRKLRQLERVNLNFDSPRLKQAMDDLGVTVEELEKKERTAFEKKGVDPDVVDLRFKHYQGRLIDTLNRVSQQRRQIIHDQSRAQGRQKHASASPSVAASPLPTARINHGRESSQNLLLQTGQQFNSAVSPKKRVSQNISPLPGIEQKQSAGGAGLFLTDVVPGAASRTTQAKTAQKLQLPMTQVASPMVASPSQRNYDNLQNTSFSAVSQMPIEQMIQQEKRKILAQSARSRSIVMMNQMDKKKRLQLEKSIDKKMAKAERSARMTAKEFHENIKKSNEKAIMKSTAARQMKKMEERERSHNIKELIESDKKGREKVYEMRRKQLNDLIAKKEPERERREKARSFVVSEDNTRRLNLASRLAEIEEKMNNHEVRRFSERNRMVIDAHARNTTKDNKFSEIAMQKKENEQNMYREFELAENAKHKKLRKIHKEMNYLWTDFKEKRNAKNDLMKTRQAGEEESRREKQREMMKKLQRSQVAVEAYMKEQQHKNMLAQEQRKLMDDDMKKLQQRQKRLETRKKIEILGKEEKDKQLVQEVRKREQKMVDFRYRNRISSLLDERDYHRSLDSWAKKGFTNSGLPKDDVELQTIIDKQNARVRNYIRSGRSYDVSAV